LKYLSPVNNKGYCRVCLYLKNGRAINKYIHRLVAKAFVKGYEEGLTVDHIDENKANNNDYNLQWLTLDSNIKKSLSKPVLQLSLDGEIVREWDSTMHAHRVKGFLQGNISRVCTGKRKTAGGYVWVYSSDYDEDKNYKTQSLSIPIMQLTLGGDFIREWDSMGCAGRECGFDIGHISKVCSGKRNTHKGFKWKYKYKQLE
jgi:hypothetical protein